MKCSFCNGDLSFPENVLKQISVCPFCNEPFDYERAQQAPEIAPKSVNELLCMMVQKHGLDIFDEKNIQKLNEELATWPQEFIEERDHIKLLCIKNIPHILYTKRDTPLKEQYRLIADCCTILNKSFSIEIYAANKMVDIVHSAIKAMIREKAVSLVSSTDVYEDTRDGNTYRTTKIGDQVWLAENFRYDCEGSFAKDYAYLDEYGRLYNWDAAEKNAPPGWHLPTSSDLKKLKSFAKKNKPRFSWDFFSSYMEASPRADIWQIHKTFLKEEYFKDPSSLFIYRDNVRKQLGEHHFNVISGILSFLEDFNSSLMSKDGWSDKDLSDWANYLDDLKSGIIRENRVCWKGLDSFGLNIKPAGCIKQNRVLENFGEKAFFWLGDSNSKTNANCMILDRNQLMENSARKTMLYSVRYILD